MAPTALSRGRSRRDSAPLTQCQEVTLFEDDLHFLNKLSVCLSSTLSEEEGSDFRLQLRSRVGGVL
eukprot:2008438-Amphidinium_carterae.1